MEIFFTTIVLMVLYENMVLEERELFKEILILGYDILVRIVSRSDEVVFLGENFLQDEEPSIIISIFDLADLYTCDHILYRNLIIGHFLIIDSNNQNQLSSRFSFEGLSLQVTSPVLGE